MDIPMAEWLRVVLAGLALLTCVVVLVTTLGMRALALESTTTGDTDTRVVNLRLLESRVGEPETTVAGLERSRGSTDTGRDVVDLRVGPRGRPRHLTRVITLPSDDG